MGALELHILLAEFGDVNFKRSPFTMKWNESESEVVYSDPAIQRSTCLSPTVVYSNPAIDMSQSNHLRRREGGGASGCRKIRAEIQTVD